MWHWVPRFTAVALAAFWSSAQAAGYEPGAHILAYHRFSPTFVGPTTITAAAFEQQLEWLAAHHIRVVPLREIVVALQASTPVDSGVVAITVDDGHPSVYTQLFPLVQRHRIPVTVFVIAGETSRIPEALTWEQLREMEASGLVDVQSHTLDHPDFTVERQRRTNQDFDVFVEHQLVASRSLIEAHLHHPVDLLAWPYRNWDKDLEIAAERAGYVAAFALGAKPVTPEINLYAVPRHMVLGSDSMAAFAEVFSRKENAENR